MKHLKTFFAFMLMAVLSIGQVWAAETVYKTALFGSSYNSKGVSGYTNVSFSSTNNGFTVDIVNANNNNNGWNLIKIGGKNGAYTGSITTHDAIDKAITKVDLTIDAITTNNVTSITLKTSSNGSSWSDVGTFTKATGTKTVTLSSPTTNLYYKIEAVCTKGSSNGLLTISKVEYYAEEGGTPESSVKAVQFTPDGGTFANSKSVTLSQEDSKAIFYTTNATAGAGDPSTSSPWSAYTSALTLTESTTIYAAAKDGDNWSSVTSKTFTIYSVDHTGTQEDPYSVADARTAIDANAGLTNVYATGTISQIDSYNSQYNSITYWISDDGTTTDQLEVYSGKGLNNTKFTAVTDLTLGDIVTVYGTLKKFNSTYEFDKNNYIVSLEHPASAGGVITAPESVEVPAAGEEDGSISISFTNIDVDNVENVAIFNDAEHTSQYTGNWLVAAWNENKTAIEYTAAANENTAARTAYIYLYALDNNGDEVEKVISVTQAEYVAPFSGLELTFPDDGDGGNNISSYTATWSAVIGTQTWSIYGFNTNKWGWNPAVIKTGRKNNSGTAQPLTATIETQVVDHAVGDIVVTIDAVTASLVTSHKLYVADNSDYTDAIEIDGDPSTIAEGNITYTVPSANRANDLYYKLEYATAGTGSSNGILTISKITYAYANATPQKQSTGLAFEDADKNNLVKVGANFTAPTLTNPNKLTGISYESSDANVVAVNSSTGTLTIKAAGKAVITASRAEDETYKAGSASYTVYVAAQAGTAADPLTEASAKTLIDLGCGMTANVGGTITGSPTYNETYHNYSVTLTDGFQFYRLKDLNNADFTSGYLKAGDEVVAVGPLAKHSSTYELAEGCYLTSYTEYKEPSVTLKQSGSEVSELELAATNVSAQTIDLTYTNFENTISSVTPKLYSESTCETEITSGAWVTDITVNEAKTQLTFNVADNDSEARQVWMKVTASDGTNTAYAVLAISQAKFIVDYATLPFAFNGGKADIATTNGITQEGLGTDYNNSPFLKFDGTGDYVIIKINAAPGTLTYDIKGNGFSGSTFTVQKSANGTTYTDIETYTTLGDKQSESKGLDQETRFVKFIYTEKVQNGGNVALGNIGITAYVAPAVKPTITTQPEGAEYTQGDTPNALTIVAEAANEGELSYQWYSNSSESTEGAAVIDGATEDGYTPSTEELGTIYYYCVVTEVGAEETTTSSIVAVVVSAAPEPTGTFELFSGELAEGDYVITYDSEKALKCEINSDRFASLEVTATEDKITNPDASIIWHIAPSGDYWTIYNTTAEKYAASTGAKNKGALLDEGTDDKALWSVSESEFVNKYNAANSVNATLRYNSQNDLNSSWACYSTQTGATPTLYKKQIAGQPKTPTFTVDGGTFTIAQNVEIECATEGVTIYYTLDGSTPTNESKVYSTALEISSTTTVKAIAIKNAIASDVASATYKIVSIDHAGTEADPYTIADARNAIEVGGDLSDKYVSGIISQVDGYNSTYKSITYWISDDGETTSSQLQVYSGKGLNGADFSSINDLQTGDIVVVKGTLKLYESTYEFDKDNQLVSYAKPNVPTVALKKSGSIVTVLNVEAKDVASQAIDIECTYFANAISSVSAILYGESTCETEIISGAWVTDITINDAKDKVTFNVADNEGARRQVWMKVSASDGTNEASATMKISQAKAAYATYPFAFDGGIEDVTNAGGMTQYGLGSDYTSSPKLKFDNTGDWLIIKTNEAPSQLTYDIKNNSFSEGTFTVQESADGENYTVVASYTDITGTQNEAVDLDQATRYIKFIYTEKVNGNVGLGNINIKKYVAPEPPTPEEIWTEGVREELIEGRYYTMCLNKAVTKVRGASIWKVLSKATDGGIILEEVVGTLDAGRPYFFYATAESMDVVYTGAVVDNPVNDADNNGLVGSFERTEITKNQSNYILHNNALYFVNSEAYVGAYRAYLNMSAVPNYVPAQGNSPRRRVTMSVHAQDVATGVDAISDSEQPMKVMIDNHLYIIRAGQMYDMTGNKVK